MMDFAICFLVAKIPNCNGEEQMQSFHSDQDIQQKIAQTSDENHAKYHCLGIQGAGQVVKASKSRSRSRSPSGGVGSGSSCIPEHPKATSNLEALSTGKPGELTNVNQERESE